MQVCQRKHKCLVVIPALNEAETITEVIAKINESGYRNVVVVNDASDDLTAPIARAAGAMVISLPERLGAWGALQTGIRFAIRKNYDTVVTLDADGQHPPEHIESLVSALYDGQANVVIGCFPQRGSKLRQIAWHWIRNASGIQLSDLTSGFRAYDGQAQRLVAGWRGSLLEYQDVGVLLLLQRHHLRVQDVNVTMTERRVGQSRIFYNWSVVAYYMLHTLLLSAAKRKVRRATSGNRMEGVDLT